MAPPKTNPPARSNPRLPAQPSAPAASKQSAKPAGKPAAKPVMAVKVASATAKPANAGVSLTQAAPRKPTSSLRVIRAEYIASVKGIGEVPAGPPEIAIVGRSNVGKSSLLNAMCNHQGLARTSKTPGRTQAINLFDATLSSGQMLRLVDLPGFGHAEVSKKLMSEFSEMIQFFLLASEHLRLVLILQDSRRDRDDDAIGFAQWLRDNNVPCAVVATKADEVSKTKIGSITYRLQHEFGLARPALAVSVRDGRGIDELLLSLRNVAFGQPRAKKAGAPKPGGKQD